MSCSGEVCVAPQLAFSSDCLEEALLFLLLLRSEQGKRIGFAPLPLDKNLVGPVLFRHR